jgi:hypothetical protein
MVIKTKAKAIFVTDPGGSCGCGTSRLSDFLGNRLRDDGEVANLKPTPAALYLQDDSKTFLLLAASNPALSAAERMMSIENPINSKGIEPATFMLVA